MLPLGSFQSWALSPHFPVACLPTSQVLVLALVPRSLHTRASASEARLTLSSEPVACSFLCRYVLLVDVVTSLMLMGTCVCVPHTCLLSLKASDCSYRCGTPWGCWELNRGPLEEQPVFLMPGPSLQPLMAFLNANFHTFKLHLKPSLSKFSLGIKRHTTPGAVTDECQEQVGACASVGAHSVLTPQKQCCRISSIDTCTNAIPLGPTGGNSLCCPPCPCCHL